MLLRRLARGGVVSGARYAAETGIGRTAVRKQVGQLRGAGLPVDIVRGRGYRLAWPIDLLDADRIRQAAGPGDAGVEVVSTVDSTNRALLGRFRHRHALVAEYQSAGRGRRGRSWVSPPGCGLCISFAFRFDVDLPRLRALSLAAGVAVAETLAAEGVPVRLKWPNDLVVHGRKLGGLLIEVRGPGKGPCRAVIGVGINVRLPRADQAPAAYVPPDQPWTDLHAQVGRTIDRNRTAGGLIAALDAACGEFDHAGFEAFASRWAALDALRGRQLRVSDAHRGAFRGIAGGVTRAGMLCVGTDGGIVELDPGEVSVRAD